MELLFYRAKSNQQPNYLACSATDSFDDTNVLKSLNRKLDNLLHKMLITLGRDDGNAASPTIPRIVCTTFTHIITPELCSSSGVEEFVTTPTRNVRILQRTCGSLCKIFVSLLFHFFNQTVHRRSPSCVEHWCNGCPAIKKLVTVAKKKKLTYKNEI